MSIIQFALLLNALARLAEALATLIAALRRSRRR